MTDFATIEHRFRASAPAVEFCTLRMVRSRHESVSVRRGVVQPVRQGESIGAMVTVCDGGIGYAATPDLSESGLRQAFEEARAWAAAVRGNSVIDAAMLQQTTATGGYASEVSQPWSELPLSDKLDLLRQQCERLKCHDKIVNWEASLWFKTQDSLYLSSAGARIEQRLQHLLPGLSATAVADGEAQTRSLGGHAFIRQGGLETLAASNFADAAPAIGEQALQLLAAPNCPSETMDLVLAPDQMILQIHESIGHPLELDRILGDERNYAGTSFVTADMFGSYRYGSELLNVTFDPLAAGEAASFAFDDDGSAASREYLIKQGVLQRPLGGMLSQRRANLPGVANSRAHDWNRAPIDRMANINLEPVSGTLNDLIAGIERGVYMETNRSWSIDDSRNKFQFGCEWGRLIEQGELAGTVKNPNYRGVSAEFWRNLSGVAGAGESQFLGTPYCGKGEPNQVITVGHASPPCQFQQVAVFGGG